MAIDFELLRDFSSPCLELIVIRHELLNPFNRHRALVVLQHVAQHILRERERYFLSGKRRKGNQPDERALELADI